jgi:hypothetical protein
MELGIIRDGAVALAVSVEPIARLMFGSASDIGRRSSAQYLFHMSSPSSLRVAAVDAIDAASIVTQADQIAEELTARLALKLKSLRR